MEKIKIKNMKKSYGSRDILNIEDLRISGGERVGLIGNNGQGKTSLLKIITGQDQDYSGQLSLEGRLEYVSQLEDPENKFLNGKYSSIFGVPSKYSRTMSGGEKTRFKIGQAFSKDPDILILDEPTSNLDLEAIDLVIDQLKDFKNTLLLVSHDRNLLDSTCNRILELRDGKIKSYRGNYSSYKQQKEIELETAQAEYNKYLGEKARLISAKENIDKKSSSIKRTPSRMGNSEARLHRMGGQKNKKNLDNSSKALESRISHLDVKEKPKEEESISLKILDTSRVHSKLLVSGKKLNKKFGKKQIFENASLSLENNVKYGLLGPNGSGKTSLIEMIVNGEGLDKSQNLKIGYFNQEMKILDFKKTILENLMETSIYDENFVRLVLARLLFRGDRVYELVENLSGGERVKVSLAKIILEDVNMLILDEPTNYLDISSLEVIEDILRTYEGSVLLVSHDRQFIDNIVDEILLIEGGKILNFKGNLSQYQASKNKESKNNLEVNKKLLLENELSKVLGELSVQENQDKKEILNKRYIELMREIRDL